MVRLRELREQIAAARRADDTIHIVEIKLHYGVQHYRNWIQVYALSDAWAYSFSSTYLRAHECGNAEATEMCMQMKRITRYDIRNLAELEKKEKKGEK